MCDGFKGGLDSGEAPKAAKMLENKELSCSEYDTSNYCIAVMHTQKAECIKNMVDPDPKIIRMLN